MDDIVGKCYRTVSFSLIQVITLEGESYKVRDLGKYKELGYIERYITVDYFHDCIDRGFFVEIPVEEFEKEYIKAKLKK